MDETARSRRIVVSDSDIAGGEPIFRGTRVTVATLFDHLEDGIPLGQILESFPTLDRGDVLAVLREAPVRFSSASTSEARLRG